MKNTAIFVLKKYLAELLLAALFLYLWSFFDNAIVETFDGSFFEAVLVVFAGTIVLGYLFFLCAVGVVSLFLPQARSVKFIAICALSFLYVLVFLILSPKNGVSIPIALGILIVNIVYPIRIYHSKKQA